MTACVLYSDSDFEPITVFDVPQWAWDMLIDGCVVRFAPQIPVMAYAREPDPMNMVIPIVEVFAEPLWRKNIKTLMLFTRHDEWALRLRSTLLPGQRGDVRDQMQDAFFKGFLTALRSMP